jgi:hypothetical protein
MIRNAYGRFPAKRRKHFSPAVMSQEQLRNALIRAVVLEYQNGKTRTFPGWGWEQPPSMYVLRQKRLNLARQYAHRYQPVAAALLGRRLPRGRQWPGTRDLIPSPIYSWIDDVWTHVGCTVPIGYTQSL